MHIPHKERSLLKKMVVLLQIISFTLQEIRPFTWTALGNHWQPSAPTQVLYPPSPPPPYWKPTFSHHLWEPIWSITRSSINISSWIIEWLRNEQTFATQDKDLLFRGSVHLLDGSRQLLVCDWLILVLSHYLAQPDCQNVLALQQNNQTVN